MSNFIVTRYFGNAKYSYLKLPVAEFKLGIVCVVYTDEPAAAALIGSTGYCEEAGSPAADGADKDVDDDDEAECKL